MMEMQVVMVNKQGIFKNYISNSDHYKIKNPNKNKNKKSPLTLSPVTSAFFLVNALSHLFFNGTPTFIIIPVFITTKTQNRGSVSPISPGSLNYLSTSASFVFKEGESPAQGRSWSG